MSPDEVRERLRHMLDHAREILDLTHDKTRAELDSDRVLTLALTGLPEIIGEAAGRIPPQERSQHPDIPWPEIVGLRNRLIHGYDSVDNDILWQIITQDIPDLVQNLETATKS